MNSGKLLFEHQRCAPELEAGASDASGGSESEQQVVAGAGALQFTQGDFHESFLFALNADVPHAGVEVQILTNLARGIAGHAYCNFTVRVIQISKNHGSVARV